MTDSRFPSSALMGLLSRSIPRPGKSSPRLEARGFLVIGMPGTGKSMFAECLARELSENPFPTLVAVEEFNYISYGRVIEISAFLVSEAKKGKVVLDFDLEKMSELGEEGTKKFLYLLYLLEAGAGENIGLPMYNLVASMGVDIMAAVANVGISPSFADVRIAYVLSTSKREQLIYTSLLENMKAI